MHVYLREQKTQLTLQLVDPEGLAPQEAGLLAVAFYAEANERPSFRALLPPETVQVLEAVLREPVTLALLAEEPESPRDEVHATVGVSVPVGAAEMEGAEDEAEPWRSDPEAWRGEADGDDAAEDDGAGMRTAVLAFAPLVRLQRRHPDDFAEELADLLESALSGATRPALEARVDQMLGGL